MRKKTDIERAADALERIADALEGGKSQYPTNPPFPTFPPPTAPYPWHEVPPTPPYTYPTWTCSTGGKPEGE